MKERELADLLIQMGVDSGLEIERAAEELASVSFPAFVSAKTFKSALLETIESQMRAQMEQRLQAMRQRFDAPGTSPNSNVARPQPASSPVSQSSAASPVAATEGSVAAPHEIGPMDTIVSDMSEDDTATSDDTIVWSPRRD